MPDLTLAADAGAPLAALVTGPSRPARVLGAFPSAVYLWPEGERPIAIETPDGVGLPNALGLQRRHPALDLAATPMDVPAAVGDGMVRLGALTVVVDRWVDHTYRPAGVDVVLLRRRLDQVDAALAVLDVLPAPLGERVTALDEAAADGSEDALVTAGRSLLGLGPGLTPSGDDVLCGLLASARTLAAALGADRLDAALQQVGTLLAAEAPDRTTALSAALIHHAAAAELARPARGLLRALLGRTPVGPALAALLAVGHSSGRDLAVGLTIGVRAALHAVSVSVPTSSSGGRR